ncbi:MAG: hypothetical protein HKM24_01325 [Gammaproteobacteria bacterium]|nr:hypothetical protein [Gammaproteobacteria bacterium]
MTVGVFVLYSQRTWSEEMITIRGHYVSAFEVSSFVPLDEGEPGYGKGYWLTVPEPTNFWQQLNALFPELDENQLHQRKVLMTVTGSLSAQGHYGHLGAYSHEFVATTIDDMKRYE